MTLPKKRYPWGASAKRSWSVRQSVRLSVCLSRSHILAGSVYGYAQFCRYKSESCTSFVWGFFFVWRSYLSCFKLVGSETLKSVVSPPFSGVMIFHRVFSGLAWVLFAQIFSPLSKHRNLKSASLFCSFSADFTGQHLNIFLRFKAIWLSTICLL